MDIREEKQLFSGKSTRAMEFRDKFFPKQAEKDRQRASADSKAVGEARAQKVIRASLEKA